MELKKVIKKIGNSAGNIFNKDEMKAHNMEVGDIIVFKEIEIIKHKMEDKQ